MGKKKRKKEEFIHLGPIEIILFHKFNVNSCEVHMLEGTIKEFLGFERTSFVNKELRKRPSKYVSISVRLWNFKDGGS